MKDGKPLPGEGTTRVTEENLASGVDYTVYAAARRGDLIGDVVTFGFTTGTATYDDLLLAEGGKDALLEQLFISSPRVTEFTEPSEWTYLDPETEYIHYVIGVDERGDRTALLEKPFTTPEEQEVDVNTENLAFAHAILASYYGMSEDDDGNTVHNFYILVADQNMLPDEYGDPYPVAFPCHALNCDFYAATRGGDELTLAEGTYTFSDTSAAGTWSSYDSWAAYFDEQEEMYEFSFGGGTITVAHEGTDYRLTFDLTTEKGKAYTGTYTGPIIFEDYSFSPFAIGKSRWAAPRAPHGARTPLR